MVTTDANGALLRPKMDGGLDLGSGSQKGMGVRPSPFAPAIAATLASWTGPKDRRRGAVLPLPQSQVVNLPAPRRASSPSQQRRPAQARDDLRNLANRGSMGTT